VAKIVTIIDIGSNSVRMVIYEKTSRYAFHLLHEEKSKVRISQDAYKHNGELQALPMQRTFNALRDFLSISSSFKSRKMLCVATSALRDAPNKADFIQKVKRELKLNIKIISGEKEAYFGAIACANLLPKQYNAMSVDVGGGSTEIAFIDANDVSHTISLKLGTVRLKELFFDQNNQSQAIGYIDKELENLNASNITTLIGIGGTFRAISEAIQKVQNYPLENLHAYSYNVTVFQDYIKQLLQAQTTQELKTLGIKSERFDVIKPGVLILQRIVHKLQVQKIITSGVGVREGVYLSDLLRSTKHKFPQNYNTSVRYILDTHVANKEYSNNIALLTKKIFDLTHDYFQIESHYRYELALAAKLYPAGSSVHFYSQNKHTYYLIQSALEYGFTHENVMLIATLTKYAKNKLPANTHLQKYEKLLPDTHTCNVLSFILSLAITLLSHRPRNIDFTLTFKENTLFINAKHRLYLAQEASKKLECSHKDFQLSFL